MRKLLATVVISAVAMAAGLWQSSDASAASLGVATNIYHPTYVIPGTAYLACGWHGNCDNVFPDANPIGLDWRPCDGRSDQPCPPSNQVTWVRFKSYTWTGSGWVAQTRSFDVVRNGCPGIDTLVLRWSNTNHVIGIVRNNHSHAGSTGYMNLWGSPSGTQASGGIGAFIDPDDDPCSGYWHTMQWYISGAYDSSWVKNTDGFPGEAECHRPNCAQPYGLWTTYEYAFNFKS